MLTLLANHARPILNPSADYSARSARQQNLSTGATVALVVGGLIVVPMIIFGIIAAVGVNAVTNAANNSSNRLPPGTTPDPFDPNIY